MSKIKIRIAVGQAVEAFHTLQETNVADPVACYHLSRLLADVSACSDVIALEGARNKLIVKHGEPEKIEKKNGDVVEMVETGRSIVPQEKMGDFMLEYAPLAGQEIELDAHALPLSILPNLPPTTKEKMSSLLPFFDED